MSAARQVPFENEVFVGDSPQDMHGEYADEQLTTIQKRICLIEFLFMVGLLFVKASAAPTKNSNTLNGCFNFWFVAMGRQYNKVVLVRL